MLIGADVHWNIVENKIVRRAGSTAVKSKLGYLFETPTFHFYKRNNSISCYAQCVDTT